MVLLLTVPILSEVTQFYDMESWKLVRNKKTRVDSRSILKETNPEYSLEGQMLKLNLQYFGHLMQRSDLWEKTLMLGKD